MSGKLRLEVEWVLEELRWLTGAEFDAGVAFIVEATGGVHWSVWEARRTPLSPVERQIHITRGQQSLVGEVDKPQQAAAGHIFKSWPAPGA